MNVSADESLVRAVSIPPALTRLLPGVLHRVRQASGASLTFAGTMNTHSRLELDMFHGHTVGALAGVSLDPGRGLGGKVVVDRRTMAVADYVATTGITHHYDRIISAEGLRAMVAAPVILFGIPVAVIYSSYRSAREIGDRIKEALASEARSLEQRVLLAESLVVARGELLESAPYSEPGYRELQVRTREAYGELRAIAGQVSSPDIHRRLLRVAESLGDAEKRDDKTVGPSLTERERDLLGLVAAGATNAQIAATLGLTVNTVKSYMKAAMRKLGASTRLEAVVVARRNRQIP